MKAIYFDLEELVCPDVFNYMGESAWQLFDPRLIETLDNLRERLNKKIIINDWKWGGKNTQSGYRCLKCGIVKDAIAQNKMYVSAHMTGQAVDFHVEGMLPEETRQWIIKNQSILRYNIRMEKDVAWVHLDTRDTGQKIFMFNA